MAAAKNSAFQVPPLPQKTPLVDNNKMITEAWNKFFITLFQRVGNNVTQSSGNIGLTLTQIQSGLSQGRQL